MVAVEERDLTLSEERLARMSVLQELTVAALDLFDPRRSMDDFLDRLAVRLGCAAALCLGDGDDGLGLRLLGQAGLTRASRELPIPALVGDDWASLALPYPELSGEGMVRWVFRVTPPAGQPARFGTVLLIFFAGPPRLAPQYHGVVERLSDIVRTAVLHRRLYARTLESERRLYEQKTLLECQSEASREGILFVSTELNATFNSRFAELFGLAPGGALSAREVAARVSGQVVRPEGFQVRLERLVGRAGEPSRDELTLRDGRVLDVSCAPIKSAEGLSFGRGWYFRDITDRRLSERERARLLVQEHQAREEAEEAQRRTAFLAESSRLLAASLDYSVTLERVAHLALPSFADWCVVDLFEEDRVGHRVEVAHVDPECRELSRRLREQFPPLAAPGDVVGRVLIGGQPELHPEVTADQLRAMARDEEHLAVLQGLGVGSMVVVPLLVRGRCLGAISLVRGPSGRRYGPADLALAEDLACRATQAMDNARLYRRTREAVGARDEFLSIASHELRTPVTSLLLAVQGLLRLASGAGLESAPTGFVVGSLTTAVRQTTRMAQLIDRLLDVSRIQAGRLELQLEQVDLSSVVREIATQSAGQLASCGSELVVRAPSPVIGRWDRARLEQVVTNLLSNAMKYGAGKPIEVTVECEGPTARLSVSDRGIGIPPDRLRRVFERFERAVSSRNYSGLGLGLYIVRRLLDALGGSVQLASVLGEGTTVLVELSLAGPADPGRVRDVGET